MIFNLNQINIYSQCPRLFNLTKKFNKNLISEDIPIWKDIIYSAYKTRLLYNKDEKWVNIRRTIGKELYTQIQNDTSLTELDKNIKLSIESEKVLFHIKHWYEKIYLKDNRYGAPNIKANIEISSNIIIQNNIPLILVDEEKNTYSILILSTVEPKLKTIFNSFSIRSTLWLASKYTNCNVNLIEVLYISNKIPRIFKFKIHKGTDSMDPIILDLIKAMNSKLYWPSRTLACNKCVFKKECKL